MSSGRLFDEDASKYIYAVTERTWINRCVRPLCLKDLFKITTVQLSCKLQSPSTTIQLSCITK